MSEKVRAAIFNILGDITDLEILDVYSGSGALAIEALSLGAKAATAIEKADSSAKTIKSNAAKLNPSPKLKVIRANFSTWSDLNMTKRYDIILADPPYDEISETALKKLPQHLITDGILVLSWPKAAPTINLNGTSLVTRKEYGDANLVFYRKVS